MGIAGGCCGSGQFVRECQRAITAKRRIVGCERKLLDINFIDRAIIGQHQTDTDQRRNGLKGETNVLLLLNVGIGHRYGFRRADLMASELARLCSGNVQQYGAAVICRSSSRLGIVGVERIRIGSRCVRTEPRRGFQKVLRRKLTLIGAHALIVNHAKIADNRSIESAAFESVNTEIIVRGPMHQTRGARKRRTGTGRIGHKGDQTILPLGPDGITFTATYGRQADKRDNECFFHLKNRFVKIHFVCYFHSSSSYLPAGIPFSTITRLSFSLIPRIVTVTLYALLRIRLKSVELFLPR